MGNPEPNPVLRKQKNRPFKYSKLHAKNDINSEK